MSGISVKGANIYINNMLIAQQIFFETLNLVTYVSCHV